MSRGAAGLVILGAFALFALSSGSEERARQRAEEDRKRAVRNKHIIDTFTPLPGPQKIYTQVQDFPDNPSVTCYTPAFDPPVPSPILGQMVMLLLALPVQDAVNVPVVAGAPPTPKFTLPKSIVVMLKLQD